MLVLHVFSRLELNSSFLHPAETGSLLCCRGTRKTANYLHAQLTQEALLASKTGRSRERQEGGKVRTMGEEAQFQEWQHG